MEVLILLKYQRSNRDHLGLPSNQLLHKKESYCSVLIQNENQLSGRQIFCFDFERFQSIFLMDSSWLSSLLG
jgi:hypothetical protein